MVNYGNAAGLVFPSGDTTGATDTPRIQNAISGGAQLAAGTFYTNVPLTLDTGQVLCGSGPGTTITAATGFTGTYMVTLKTAASSIRTTIRDLTLKPATGTVGGILIDNTGLNQVAPAPFDPLHLLRNILVLQAGGDAFHFDNNARELRVENCKQYYGEGYGFYLGNGPAASGAGCTDSHFTDCTSGPSKQHGWYIRNGYNMFTSCKAFWAGYDQNATSWGTTQCGFEIDSGVSNATFTSCTAQQAALHGFDLQGCAHVTLAGCEADTNSAGNGVTTGVGINTNAATSCTIAACTGINNGSLSPGAQAYGIQVAGNQTGTVFNLNTVTGSSGLFNYVSGFGYTLLTTSDVEFGNVGLFKVPAIVLSSDGVQALSSSGTIKTATDGNFGLIPVSETGNVTGMILEAPSNAGTMVQIVNRSNFTITFAASGTSHVAAGAAEVIPAFSTRAFVYDGGTSLWYGT